MDFAENKLTSFTKKIIDLIDQPNMQPNELKAYFDSSPEEVRQAHNSLCDALTTATSAATAAANLGFQTTAGVPADNVQDAIENVQEQLDAAVMGNIPSGSVTQDKLAQDVRDRFTAIETAAATEVTNRTNGDNSLQNQINTHTSQISTLSSSKCEVYIGSYAGNDAEQRDIALGFQPKAVLLLNDFGAVYNQGYSYGGLALLGQPSGPRPEYPGIVVTQTGFTVYNKVEALSGGTVYRYYNQINRNYYYIAFR